MHSEKTISVAPGWFYLFTSLAVLAGAIFSLVAGIRAEVPLWIIGSVLLIFIDIVLLCGLFIVNPNEAAALLLFGNYKGTVKSNGFFWANPFMTKQKISLRARNLNGEKIKVNDSVGNPIEIAAVVVWRSSRRPKPCSRWTTTTNTSRPERSRRPAPGQCLPYDGPRTC